LSTIFFVYYVCFAIPSYLTVLWFLALRAFTSSSRHTGIMASRRSDGMILFLS
jgi:hypothetical protein